MSHLWRFLEDRSGLATIEYALLLSFIGLIIAIAMSALATAVDGELADTTSELTQ